MKFWKDFKAFISKGNIIDLAVAVVIGTAFNQIVTSLVNDIIMPLITWALGAESLADLSVVLQRDAEGVATLTWNYGNFIQAIINFLIIALTIFVVLRIMMKSAQLFKETTNKFKMSTKDEKKILKEKGVDLKDKRAVRVALNELHAEQEKEKKAKEEADKEEKYRNSTEGLLKEIRDLLKENKNQDETKLEQQEKTKENED